MINVLPQHIANQIAAGEVVQRPASIVKELMENSIDAGAMELTVRTLDGGRTLIQVIDNGMGMSDEDAPKAFLRHATSKIKSAEDLFNLHTFGFRGEALASISAVAEVELRTRRAADTIATQITICGGSTPVQESLSAPQGTNIQVRNLFFNTPARRKFLKTNASENKQIIAEFFRVALVNPDIKFTLIVDDSRNPIQLAPSNLHQRIVALTNKTLGKNLLPLETQTPVVNISGYIGTPTAARKVAGEQYFFVNGRYMRNPYLQKAIVSGYGRLLTAELYPAFFIYIEVDPSRLDVNIHPTKSEVKFEEEQMIWQVLNSAVRQTLGKHNIVPSLDFENQVELEIPNYNRSSREQSYPQPATSILSGYNPFKSYDSSAWDSPHKWEGDPEQAPFSEAIPDYLLSKFDDKQPVVFEDQPVQSQFDMDIEPAFGSLQYASRYIITTTADGIVLIDYPRALQRIAYERILASTMAASSTQNEMHPEQIELSAMDFRLIIDSQDEIATLGFDIRATGGTTVALYGMPSELAGKVAPGEAIESLLDQIQTLGDALEQRRQRMADHLTRRLSHIAPRALSPVETAALLSDLFATDEPSYTPNQLPIIEIITPSEIEKRFKR